MSVRLTHTSTLPRLMSGKALTTQAVLLCSTAVDINRYYKLLIQPNLVKFYCATRYASAVVYLLEYISGGTLDRLYNNDDNAPDEARLSIFKQICQGVEVSGSDTRIMRIANWPFYIVFTQTEHRPQRLKANGNNYKTKQYQALTHPMAHSTEHSLDGRRTNHA